MFYSLYIFYYWFNIPFMFLLFFLAFPHFLYHSSVFPSFISILIEVNRFQQNELQGICHKTCSGQMLKVQLK